MDIVVYADILFLIDFSMDFLTFYIVSHILRKKLQLLRVCSAAAMGGIYSVVSLGIGLDSFFALFLDIFVCFVMCMTAFLEKSPRELRKMPLYTATFFVVSAMLGGIMTAFFGFLNRKVSYTDSGREDLSLWVFGFVALISGLATFLGSDLLGRTSRAKFGVLHVRIGGRSMSFEAISDSGNMLKDPIGGKDVIVLDKGKASPLFPELSYKSFSSISLEKARSIRLIPIRTAAGEGMLTAFRADEVILDYDGSQKELDVLVALSKDSLGGRCEAIVSSDYFT